MYPVREYYYVLDWFLPDGLNTLGGNQSNTYLSLCNSGSVGPETILHMCSLLFSVCEKGWWGEGCLNECSCVHGICDPFIGYCNCESGYEGERCDVGKYDVIIVHSEEMAWESICTLYCG